MGAVGVVAHLEVFEAQLAAEELMLLPHVLLQVPEEAERRQLRAPWALVLQQLPGRHREPPAPADTQRRHLEQALAPPHSPLLHASVDALGAGASTGTPIRALHGSDL